MFYPQNHSLIDAFFLYSAISMSNGITKNHLMLCLYVDSKQQYTTYGFEFKRISRKPDIVQTHLMENKSSLIKNFLLLSNSIQPKRNTAWHSLVFYERRYINLFLRPKRKTLHGYVTGNTTEVRTSRIHHHGNACSIE